jgi:hypothetical protein
MRAKPELQGKLLAKGGWDYELIDPMKPQPGDIVVPKTRYSGFFNSTLDSTLRARGIRHLVFTGIATNVCVESTCATASSWNISAPCSKTPRTRLGPELHPEGLALQHRDLLRLGLHGGLQGGGGAAPSHHKQSPRKGSI